MSIVEDAAHLALVELDGDILQCLKEDEILKAPNAALVCSQPQIKLDMRPQLVEFSAQAQCASDLQPDTLASAVSVLDRYMSRRVVFARHYQLLGCVCLWLAAKTIDNKSRSPTTATLSYLCANTYAESMFCEMELHVLTTLDWSILSPITSDFIDLSVDEAVRDLAYNFDEDDYQKLQSMVHFISECALFSFETLGMKPSTLAATGAAFSTLVLDIVESRKWPSVFPNGCAHECFEALVTLMASPPQECINRYGGIHEQGIPYIFLEFYRRYNESARKMANFNHKRRNYSLAGFADLEFSEPSTPVRSRQVSLDSACSPSTPYDDDLVSPETASNSPNTYVMPSTPEEIYNQESIPGLSTKIAPFF